MKNCKKIGLFALILLSGIGCKRNSEAERIKSCLVEKDTLRVVGVYDFSNDINYQGKHILLVDKDANLIELNLDNPKFPLKYVERGDMLVVQPTSKENDDIIIRNITQEKLMFESVSTLKHQINIRKSLERMRGE